ncbi:MAG: aminopeptidase [Flavobacteriales bacterium]|nr:aminopeptidase [Bacteroidota bacterium]MCB9240822.1 aminopeptidase [Flavobacteriales bacterium]
MKHLLFTTLILITSMGSWAQSLPKGMKLLNTCEATEVKSQDRTGTCWSFSTTSYLESEVLRTQHKTVNLSEMYTVRNIYVEKAERYLRYHGHRPFSQGSLAHDVYHAYDAYGMMTEEAYPGKQPDSLHNHTAMEKTLKSYLDSILKTGTIPSTWKTSFNQLLDSYLGTVPSSFTYEGKSYTPATFTRDVLKLNMGDYVGFTSFAHQPLHQFVVVQVPDNFSDGTYFNTKIDDLVSIVNHALSQGMSIEWDGDVSETGFLGRTGYAVLCEDTTLLKNDPLKCQEPAINQMDRQKEFDNLHTTDDHLMHITGLVKHSDGRTFYLVKNSWGTKPGWDGYLLMSEAYFKMKTVSIYLNRNALSQEFLNLISSN